jgi:hypothetical protein
MNGHGPSRPRRRLAARLGGVLTALAGASIVAVAAIPGVITGSAAGLPDVGNAGVFELDGNVAQDTASPPQYDWSCVFNNPAGHAGCPPSANPADTATTPALLGTVFQADSGNPDPTYFSSNGAGVKDVNDISAWGCGSLNNPLNKDDILNAYGAAFLAQGNAANGKAGHELLYLAQERDSNNGDSFAGFWIMHNQHACSNGTFTNPTHDPGDLLVVSNYTNGGSTSTIQLYAWDTSAANNLKMLASGFTCGAASPPSGLVHPEDICGIANSSSFTEPWAPNLSLDSNQFVEAGIDITALIDQGVFPVPSDTNASCFNDFLAETRSSQETTATLKDFTTGRFSFCVNPRVTTQQTSGSVTSPGLTVERGATVSDQATLGAPLSGTPAGTVTYNLYSSPDCKSGLAYSNTQTLSGGAVPPSAAFDTSGLTPGTTYEWQAVYSGDIGLGGHNFPAMSACGDEPLNVLDAYIRIAPLTATNPVGNQHVFQVTAAVLPAGTTLASAAISTNVSPSAGLSQNDTTCGTPTISGGTATCTITIDSNTVTTYTANAAATLVAGGVTMHRSTNNSVVGSGPHGPGGSGPATKNYVDAFITITPQTADNEVGHQHVFTVTFTALPGNATPVSFGAISASVSPTSGLTANTSTCGSPTVNGNVETCTLTINSNTAGTYTANASGAVTIGGASLSRTTAPDGSAAGPGGSGPATKHYVDAFITISPNGINPVGQSHTFNILVQAVPGGATPVSFGAITPNVTPTPGTESTTCGSPTISSTSVGPTAACTLTVDNGLANVFSATATASITMGTVTVSRTTDGTGQNSPPATKTYVDASVQIGPDADNEVGHAHTFTVTVTAIPSGATPVVFKSIAPSITPTAGLTQNTSTCSSPTVSGPDGGGNFTATCTVTIDSNTAGTYTANVTATVDMGTPAAEVVRSTNSSVAPHGPGGSGPATKTYVDADIQLSPLTATNNVGSPHTVTITVNALPSGATPVSFSNIVPTVSPTPSTAPTNSCASPAIGNGGLRATCSVTFNSNVPGIFTINAGADVTMGTVTVTRTTALGGNHGPGGTGPATKIYGRGTISIAPDAVNEVGHSHTFTVTVTSVPGTTTTFTSITTSVTPAPSSSSTTCNAPTINGNVATCTVTIDSDSAGVFTATATAHLVVNGFATSVTTDGTNGSSGPAVKTYVDASIAITPTAVNEVDHSHTFTVTVTALPADSPKATFTSIIPSVTPAPGSMSSTCAHPTVSGNTATCTVTIDSSTAGLFTADAAAVVSIGGVTLHRSTDGSDGGSGPRGSGPAFKTYVDAAVGIGPSAVNPIGKEHVFDIVVTAIPAGADPVTFGDITTSVTPTPLSSSTTCNDPTISGDQATCTLTVNSDLPTTFAANVTAEVTMGEVTVTRSTSGDHGPGGTGPATKTYVNALIRLTPAVATDPVGDIHTLTATVTQDDGSGAGAEPVPDGTVVSLSIASGPGTLSSPTCTTSGGTGTCTDTLTSAVAGTTTIHATVTITVEGVTLVRSTGDSVPGDGPDATKTWVRVSPSIATTQSAGGAPGTALSDTATVSGGHDPTGTVTFQLFAPGDTSCTGTPVFVDTPEPLTGGIAKSVTFTATASGTYQWVAVYSGDGGNTIAVSGCGSEPVTISAPAAVIVHALSVPFTGVGPAVGLGLLMILSGGLVVRISRRRRS